MEKDGITGGRSGRWCGGGLGKVSVGELVGEIKAKGLFRGGC